MLDAKLTKDVLLEVGEDDGSMHLRATQLRKLGNGEFGKRIGKGRDRQGNEDFVKVESRVPVSEIARLQLANRLDDAFGKEEDLIGDASEVL